jgi:hypothetical protein
MSPLRYVTRVLHATRGAAYDLRVKFLAALAFLVPLAAQATIYKWTDEDGRVVIANHLPETGAKNVQVVMKDDPPAPAATNRDLQERIVRLEQQVQAMQSAPPAPAYAPPAYAPAAYVPPAPMPDYYSAPYYYPPAYYPPPYYAYPVGLVAVRVIRPARFFHAPRFASSRFASFHHAPFRHR